jgi:hypothetical protein
LFGETVHALVAAPGAATDALQRAGIDVLAARPVTPSLEDVFIHLVGTQPGTGSRKDHHG